MIIKRNLLCIKNLERLDLGNKLLYDPYKNILYNFINLIINKSATDFDPVARVYHGLESVPENLKAYYEAFLGVTSYYQASKGGRGKYIEKKLASVVDSASLSISLSELPLFIKLPPLHKKKGILTQNYLLPDEKRHIRNLGWLWKGKNDVTIDVGNIISEEFCLVLTELKNRTDSGGTAGRREIWTNKFGVILEHIKNNKKLFSDGKKDYSLIEFLKANNIAQIEMYVSILFNVDSLPATKEGDRTEGFYSSNLEGFNAIKNFINSNFSVFNKEHIDDNNLVITATLKNDPKFKIIVGASYGNQISEKLFRKKYPVNELLLLKYDDMWLGQLLSIDERTFLLKYGKNFTIIIKSLLQRDMEIKSLYNKLIDSEGDENTIKELVDYLLDNFKKDFEDKLVPKDVEKERYLGDIIQIFASSES